MEFPSQAMKDWCISIQKLIDAPREGKSTHTDGLCQCEVERAISYATSPEDQAQLVSGLFWSVWIDQTMYCIAVRRSSTGAASDLELYEDFRKVFAFPKFYYHPAPGYAPPVWLLDTQRKRTYALPDADLLQEDRQEFLEEVLAWLESIERPHACKALKEALAADLDLNFPQHYHKCLSP